MNTSTDGNSVLPPPLLQYADVNADDIKTLRPHESSRYAQSDDVLSTSIHQSYRQSMSTSETVEKKDSLTRRAQNRQDLGSIESIRVWSVDFIDLPTEELINICFDIFKDMCPKEFKITDDVVIQFLKTVASHYRANPYHTFLHACYVLHSVWMMMTTTALPRYLLPHERLALYIAAICHDVDHDGYTNQFHLSSKSEMARRYNDGAVLENHHCNLTSAILEKQNCAILQSFPQQLRAEIREVVIEYIMSTDMSSHGKLVSDLCQLELPQANENENQIQCPAPIRSFLGKSVLHASDLSNPARSFEVDYFMAERVKDEFRNQVARERELGLPISLDMDIQTEAKKYETEVNFINSTVKPLWEQMARIFPSLDCCLCQMKANGDRFAKRIEMMSTNEALTAVDQSTCTPTLASNK